jgi:Domain of unknown function (DUF4192)
VTNPTRIRLTDPGSILSIVGLIMGYEPSDGDTVMLGISGQGKIVMGMRLDSEDARHIDQEQMSTVLANASRAGVESALIVGYGKDVTPAVDHLRNLIGQELPVRDALRVEGNRYWSYQCGDLDCCPVEGREFQAESEASTMLRAEGGLTSAPSRDVIAASIAGPEGEQAEAASQVWARAVAAPRSYPEAKELIVQAIADCREGKLPDRERAIELGAAITSMPVRDYAWALSDRESAEQTSELWKDVVRNVPAEAAAAPASLLAFTSWQAGNGVLANLAVDRALAADPGYSMARLVASAISAGIPPSLAEPPMTPADVEQSYIDRGRIKSEPEISDDYDVELEAS